MLGLSKWTILLPITAAMGFMMSLPVVVAEPTYVMEWEPDDGRLQEECYEVSGWYDARSPGAGFEYDYYTRDYYNDYEYVAVDVDYEYVPDRGYMHYYYGDHDYYTIEYQRDWRALDDYYDDLEDRREDYYEDLKDRREDYYDDLEDYYDDLEDRREDYYDDLEDYYEDLYDDD